MIVGFKAIPNRIPKNEIVGTTTVFSFSRGYAPKVCEQYVPFGVEFENTTPITKFKLIEQTIMGYYERFFVEIGKNKNYDLTKTLFKNNNIPIAVKEYVHDKHVSYTTTILFKKGLQTVHTWFDIYPNLCNGKFVHEYLLSIAKNDFEQLYTNSNKLTSLLDYQYKTKVAKDCAYDNGFEFLGHDDEPNIYAPIPLVEAMPEFYNAENLLDANEALVASSFEEGLLQLCPFQKPLYDNELNVQSLEGRIDPKYIFYNLDHRKYNVQNLVNYELVGMPDVVQELQTAKFIEWNHNRVGLEFGMDYVDRLFIDIFEIKLTDIYLEFKVITENLNKDNLFRPHKRVVLNSENSILYNRYTNTTIASLAIQNVFITNIASYLENIIPEYEIRCDVITVQIIRTFSEEGLLIFTTSKNEKYIIYYDYIFNLVCSKIYTTQ